MKIFVSILAGLCLMLSGCEDTNLQLATEAGVDAVKAVTLSDRDVARLAARASAESDRQHRLAGPGSPYSQRLSRLTRDLTAPDGQNWDIRVYLADQVNAFAMADGTIRIYSGLMDRMDDDELLFVIGHEMGHVVEKHSKKKLIMAYAASALRKGVASQENTAGAIAGSAIGGFVQALANAQFSQKEERAADDYGLDFLKANGYSHDAAAGVAARALENLAGASSAHSLLASHPAPEKRARRMRSAPETDESSLTDELKLTGKKWVDTAKSKIRDIQEDIRDNSESDNQ
ncbi:MAG: M48 family metallopeptidase [Desulfobacterales bacterium]|nr:M48 family metallopeptidase [Desulfobacterales bacterium]